MWISHGFWFFTPELLKTVVYSCLELSWLLKLNWEFDEAWLNIIEMRDVWWCRVSPDVVVVVMMLMRISNCYSQLLRHHDFNTNWVVLRALKIQNFFEVSSYFSGERLQLTARGQKLDEFTFNTPSVHESFSGVESDAKKTVIWLLASKCTWLLASGLYYSNWLFVSISIIFQDILSR